MTESRKFEYKAGPLQASGNDLTSTGSFRQARSLVSAVKRGHALHSHSFFTLFSSYTTYNKLFLSILSIYVYLFLLHINKKF